MRRLNSLPSIPSTFQLMNSVSHQDFVIRHSVCSEAAAVKGDAVGGSAGVHCVDLSREQAVVDAAESRCRPTNKANIQRLCRSYRTELTLPLISPVTFVPMLSLSGISSGRSLQFDTSDIFPCCSKRIFCRFCRRAVRSSLKNADEHLQASTRHCNTSEQCSRKCLSKMREVPSVRNQWPL